MYSLLKAAVRIAARFAMPMDRVMDLAQMAYFEEIRAEYPRDLSTVAKRLGISLRTVGALNSRLKRGFFSAETDVAPLRHITSSLLGGPKSRQQLAGDLSHVAAEQLDALLESLETHGFVERSGDRYQLKSNFRSFIDDTFSRRIDALNNQMDVLCESIWSSFANRVDSQSTGRTWSFAAKASAMAGFVEKTIRDLRHGAIDLEEAALAEGDYERYAVTVAFAPMPQSETARGASKKA